VCTGDGLLYPISLAAATTDHLKYEKPIFSSGSAKKTPEYSGVFFSQAGFSFRRLKYRFLPESKSQKKSLEFLTELFSAKSEKPIRDDIILIKWLVK